MICIRKKIEEAGLSGPWVDQQGLDRVPRCGGAYLIELFLKEPVAVDYGRNGQITLDPAWYFYVGSAYGPGGLASRIGRHFRKRKKIHWHIDQLTNRALQIYALPVDNGSECDLVVKLSSLREFDHPLPGFGSSDCPRCISHLLVHKLGSD